MADYQKTNIITNSISIFGGNSDLLKISFNNQSLSIGVWKPRIEGPENKRTYPAEQRVNCILSNDRVYDLLDIITEGIIPAIKANVYYSDAIPLNRDKTSLLEMKQIEGETYLIIHNNIDITTKLPGSSTIFHFDKTTRISDFNNGQGTCLITPGKGKIGVFAHCLIGFLQTAITGSSKHSIDLIEKAANITGTPISVNDTPITIPSPMMSNLNTSGSMTPLAPQIQEVSDISALINGAT